MICLEHSVNAQPKCAFSITAITRGSWRWFWIRIVRGLVVENQGSIHEEHHFSAPVLRQDTELEQH
jgi:hypothetical protein